MTTRALLPSEISLLEQTLAQRGRFRDRLFLLLAASTGFRVSELLTLRVGQLLTVTGEIAREVTIERRALKGGRSAHAKSVRSRRVALNERARAAIADYFSASVPVREAPVFISAKGFNQSIRRCQAHHILKAITRETGIDASRVGCHSARKTFARAVHEASGHDLIKTQRILGHASPLTTARYLETTQEELDEIVLRFDPTATVGAGERTPRIFISRKAIHPPPGGLSAA